MPIIDTNGSFDADLGLSGGSAVNVQMKSGTNQVHGSAFEYHSDNTLKANPFFLPAGQRKPKTINNQFGGTFGGPVWIPKVYHGKQKTFFFVSFDDTRNQDPRPGGTRSVPTQLERNGDFSQSFSVVGGQKFYAHLLTLSMWTRTATVSRLSATRREMPLAITSK